MIFNPYKILITLIIVISCSRQKHLSGSIKFSQVCEESHNFEICSFLTSSDSFNIIIPYVSECFRFVSLDVKSARYNQDSLYLDFSLQGKYMETNKLINNKIILKPNDLDSLCQKERIDVGSITIFIAQIVKNRIHIRDKLGKFNLYNSYTINKEFDMSDDFLIFSNDNFPNFLIWYNFSTIK